MGEEVNHIQIILIFAAMKPWLHILLSCFLLAACAKHEAPPPEEDMLYRVECFLQQKPDSAMQILDTLDVSVLSEKERAHCSLLRALLVNNRKQYGAELDSLLKVAENQFVGDNDKYYEAWTYWLMANKATNMQQPKQISLDAILKAKQSIEECRHVDKRLVRFSTKPTDEQTVIDDLKHFIYLELGMTYTASVYFADAIPPLRLADAYFAKREDHFNRESSSTALAYSYLLMQEFDSSLVYFQNALLSAEALGYADDVADMHHSIASYYNFRVSGNHYASEEERQSFLDKAIEETYAGFACLTDTADYGYGYVKQLLLEGLSETFYNMKQYDSCLYYGEQAIEVAQANDRLFEDYALYKRLYESCKALGDEKKAVVFADMLHAMEHPEAHMKDMAEVKDEFEKQEELQQQEVLHQRKSNRLYWMLAVSLAGLLLLGAFVYVYRRKKETETNQLQEAQHQLQSDLETAEQHSQDLLLKRTNVIYKSEEKDKLKRIMAEFDAAYPQAMEKLKSAYPDLNENECTVAVLNFLGFRIKEEAVLLNLSENTVMKYRSNLKKTAGSDPISPLLG